MSFESKLDFNKYDKYKQKLYPGNVCIRMVKSNREATLEFCVFKEEVRGSQSKGTYGRFITPSGTRSIKYSNVVFAFDKLSQRSASTDEVVAMLREFYEGNKRS